MRDRKGQSSTFFTNPAAPLTDRKTPNLTRLGDHDARRFRFSLGYVYPSTVCVYKWTELGRVRICPDYDYELPLRFTRPSLT
jgi:hypothetical protein